MYCRSRKLQITLITVLYKNKQDSKGDTVFFFSISRDKDPKRHADKHKTQLLTLRPGDTPCAGIKKQSPKSCHYCSVIRSIWTLALALQHLPQTVPVYLTSQRASNWPQTHFTSNYIDGYWAKVPFSSPEILNYTPAMCSYLEEPPHPHPHNTGTDATSELPALVQSWLYIKL